ncbi:MAG: dihydroorotate dehydrogenase electron transfer subunit [Pseudomonadota bacterium]
MPSLDRGIAPDSAPIPRPVTEQLADVLSNHPVNDEYRHLILRCAAPATAARPGQFFQLLCPQPPGEAPFLRRPMSLYGVDAARGEVEFLYKVTGAGTRGLATLVAGDRLDILGPLGVGFSLDPAWRHVVAVGRGAGLATLAPLARAARANGTSVTAVLSARRPDLLVSLERFRQEGAAVVTVTDIEATSGPAHVERLLRGLIEKAQCDAFFTCGSSRLMRVQQRLARLFALPGQVALEQQMACGLGMCFCCVRDFNIGGELVHRRVCWDGPVFDLQEAVP